MRLIIVSNRLPLTVFLENNKVIFKDSPGGLTTALSSFLESYKGSDSNESLWLGWPGISDGINVDRASMQDKLLQENNCFPVFLNQSIIDNYYNGFCNQTIWPLFHDFVSFTKIEQSYWEAYQQVNIKFFQSIASILKPNDAIWIHDYHLMLLPLLLRQHFPTLPIGFF